MKTFKKIFGLINKERKNSNVTGEKRSIEDMIVPKKWREKFDITEIKQKKYEWIVELKEKKENIPEHAKGKEIIAKGFLNKVEIISFPAMGLPVYLQFKRRRWRDKETKENYNNEYEFHPPGMKILKEFGIFLKGADNETIDTIFNNWKNIRYIRKEDFYMAS